VGKKLREYEFDVVVVGGGVAGICAALAAARHGAKTALIEATGSLGGMATSGLVPALAPYNYNEPHGEPLIRGLAWEFVERLHAEGALYDKKQYWKLFDNQRAKLVFDRMTIESGVHVRLFTFFQSVEVAGNFVKRVITTSKSGTEAWMAKCFIDATGDADLAVAAGVPFEMGDEQGGVMPPSLCFSLGGVDREKMPHPRAQYEAMAKGKLEGCLRNPEDHRGEKDICSPDAMVFNYNHIYGKNCIDADDLTHAMIEGREIAFELSDYLKETVPGFEESYVANIASLLGVRETRRIKGDFCLTASAYFESHRHEDDICVYDYACDLHQAYNTVTDRKAFEKLYYNKRTKAGEFYGIPFRCLLPVGSENLVVAGRCVSCDRTILASLRVMPPAMAMGQAAGTAAAIAQNYENRFRKIPSFILREALCKEGVYLP